MKIFIIIIFSITILFASACSRIDTVEQSYEQVDTNSNDNDDINDNTDSNTDEFDEIWEEGANFDYQVTDSMIFDVDYIFVTSADLLEEPRKIWVGDDFLNLTLREISFSNIVVVDRKFYRPWTAQAQFSGEIIVKGNLSVGFSESGWGHCLFMVDASALKLLPQFVNVPRDIIHFEITNTDKLFELLGINEKGIHPDMGFYEFENITIKIDSFELVLYPSNIGNSAEIVEVISLSGQQVQ
ncbi:MAG: hypothetical protein FWE02_04985 [Defluviitaleaceae bacterium]|nr:hypothetical protein [Defluviitaleaceae bacterium]